MSRLARTALPHAGAVIVALAVSGCTTAALHGRAKDPIVPVTVAEIQHAIACEFHYALKSSSGSGRDELEQWGAIVELKLGVKDSVNVIPGLGALSGKVGDYSLTADAATMTVDRAVEDKNTLAYFVPIKANSEAVDCPERGSATASSGLELAELLIGTAQVINSHGVITSTASLANAGIEVNGTLIGPKTTFPGFAVVPERIPTVRYQRSFKIIRKVGGGLTFDVGEVSLSLKGTGADRTRALDDNKIVITMGAMQEPQRDASPGSELENSVWEQRVRELVLLQALTPNEIIVVNPPPP